MNNKKTMAGFTLLGITLLGAVLRFINLGAEPFWGDEVLSLGIARHFPSVGQMVQYVREVEFHPPLYYILIHFWARWFGASQFAVRMPSVIFGLAAIVLTYFAGRRMFRRPAAAALAALFVAVLPMQIEYSHQARPYIMFNFFALLAIWFYWEFQESRQRSWLFGYVVAGVTGLYFHYSFAFALAALALWWLARVRRLADFREWLVAHSIIFLGFAWWLPAVFYKILVGRMEIFGLAAAGWGPRPPDFFLHVFQRLIWMSKSGWVPPALALVEFLGAAMLGWLALRVLPAAEPAQKRLMFFFAWLIFAPIAFFLFSPFSVNYTPVPEQHIIFTTVAAAFLLTFWISRLQFRPAVAATIFFCVTLAPFVAEVAANDVYSSSYYQLEPVGQYISEHYLPGDLVVSAEAYTRTDLAHYLPAPLPVVSLYPMNYYSLDFWDSRETLGFVENEYQRRIWPPSPQEVWQKLDRLIEMNKPRRVWLTYVRRSDGTVNDWFRARGARHAFRSLGDLFPLDLYVLTNAHK